MESVMNSLSERPQTRGIWNAEYTVCFDALKMQSMAVPDDEDELEWDKWGEGMSRRINAIDEICHRGQVRGFIHTTPQEVQTLKSYWEDTCWERGAAWTNQFRREPLRNGHDGGGENKDPSDLKTVTPVHSTPLDKGKEKYVVVGLPAHSSQAALPSSSETAPPSSNKCRSCELRGLTCHRKVGNACYPCRERRRHCELSTHNRAKKRHPNGGTVGKDTGNNTEAVMPPAKRGRPKRKADEMELVENESFVPGGMGTGRGMEVTAPSSKRGPPKQKTKKVAMAMPESEPVLVKETQDVGVQTTGGHGGNQMEDALLSLLEKQRLTMKAQLTALDSQIEAQTSITNMFTLRRA